MSFTCKITGHKWDGCSCSRCGARNPDFQAEHKWDVVESITDPAMAGHARKEHKEICSRCGEYRYRPHRFVMATDCIIRCAECGYEIEWHDFADGTCTKCETDESGFYCDLILMGLVRLSDLEEVPFDEAWFPNGSRSMRYADHLSKASDLASVAGSYVPRGFDAFEKLKDQKTLDDCIRKLGELAKPNGNETAEANRALYDLALSGPERLRALAASLVCDQTLASDPAIKEIIRADLDRSEANRLAGERYLTQDGI